jgi:hypothetical protein
MFGAADLKAKLAVGCYRPEISRVRRHAKLVAGMVLRKTAIRVSMGSAPGTGMQVSGKFVQFDAGASYLDPDKDVAGGRPNQEIELARCGVMLVASRFQADMAPKPAALENEAGSGRELAEIFPHPPHRLGREKPVGLRRLGPKKFARNRAVLVDCKKIFVQPAKQKLVFPLGQGRTDPERGRENRLAGRSVRAEAIVQPGFELSVQRLRKFPATYRVAAPHWLAFSCSRQL